MLTREAGWPSEADSRHRWMLCAARVPPGTAPAVVTVLVRSEPILRG